MKPVADCPKRMVYGPCGGVRADSSCEMVPIRCPFTMIPAVEWEGDEPTAGALELTGPLVLTDFTVRPFSRHDIAEVAAMLAGSCHGVLVGEHHNRPDFPPVMMATLIAAAGARPWITLTCRDRNRVVLEQEIAGLVDAEAAGVLCVTGDGRGPDVRPDVTQVFDLDGPRLAALVASAGLVAAVPEAPDAPPVELRPTRLLQKQRAGARLAVLNHVTSPSRLSEFVRRSHAAGVTMPMIAGVAVYTDARSANALQGLPGCDLDQVAVARILGAADPVAAGIDTAVAEARAVLAIDGVIGVNLSGLASERGESYAASVKAEIGRRVMELKTA